MDRFRDVLQECLPADLEFIGDPFTWRNNNHKCDNYIRERLDRAVANSEWCAHFPVFRVINGEHRHLDHRPVIICTDEEIDHGTRQGPSVFRFEAGWTKEEN